MAHVERRRRQGRNVWRARYRGPDGRERSKTFPRRVDAERFLNGVMAAGARGEWLDPTSARKPVSEIAAAWLVTKSGLSPRSRINIEGRLRNHVLPALGNMVVSRVRPSDVRAWVAQLIEQGLAPATVKGAYQIVAQIFEQAVIDDVIVRSPCRGIELPSDRNREEMLFLSAEEVNTLAASIEGRYQALIYTAAYGGLRAGELGALRVCNLQLLARTLEVQESLAEVGGRLVIGPTKTGRLRTIGLPAFLADLLGAHIGRYPARDGFAFSAAEGGPIRHRNFYARHFRPAVAHVGLNPRLRFHDLRHTCAALLIAEGRHLEEIKAHLGHSTIRVTSDRYGHLFPAAREALAASLDEAFQRAGPRSRGPTAAHDGPRPLRKASAASNEAADLRLFGADDGIRTRDPHLGKVMLYQLSHVRARRRG